MIPEPSFLSAALGLLGAAVITVGVAWGCSWLPWRGGAIVLSGVGASALVYAWLTWWWQ